MPKKSLFKSCPSCKFKKCWIKAPFCENCRYSFTLQRKPRTKPVAPPVIEEDDDEEEETPAVVPEPPKALHKICPACLHKCWHAANICEECRYDFIRKQKPKSQTSSTEEEQQPVAQHRVQLGLRPFWSMWEYQEWMDDFKGGSDAELRAWATQFLHKTADMIGGAPYSGCVVDYAESSNNKHLRASINRLAEWYVPKSGVSQWSSNLNDKCSRGELLLPTEVSTEYNRLGRDERVAVYVGAGTTMMTKTEADSYRETNKDKHLVYTTVGRNRLSLVQLPEKWGIMNQQEQYDWMYTRGTPIESLPVVAAVAPVVTKKKKK